MKAIKITFRKWLLFQIIFVLTMTSSWADISGTVFRDFNLDGTKSLLEPGVKGVIVTAYDDSNTVVSTATTDTNGMYTLNTGTGAYRVEVSEVPNFLNPGTAISGNTASFVSVVNNGITHNVGLINADGYCQKDPDILLTRFTKEGRNGTNSDIPSFLQFKYTDNGTDTPTNLANYADIGSIYGIAYFKRAKTSYLATYLKRHADIGPSGIGAIYKYDHISNTISTFITLPGIDPRNANVNYDWDHDTAAYKNVGKRGIGDIEISDDESKLFAVNLEDRKLYVIDLNESGDARSQNSYDIPNPCSNSIDFRPMGLGFRDGLLYVGVTCTAESTVDANNSDASTNGPRKGDKSQLSAHVYSFSSQMNVFSAAPVVDIDLNYDRGCIYSSDISNQDPDTCTYEDWDNQTQPYRANWNPWQMDYDIVFNDKKPGNIGNQNNWIEYMQPLLSDIEFDNDGSMIIQIRDVNGDRGGYQNYSPNSADTSRQNMNGEGDIIKACGNPESGWILESNGECGGMTTAGTNNKEGLGGGEFYWNDNGPGGTNHSSTGYTGTSGHSATSMGGLLVVPGHSEVVTGAMDVHDYLDNGLLWLRNDTGELAMDSSGDPKRLLVSERNDDQYYGKGSGLGDIEALCDAAPLEIGNYVWEDSDGDGIQDPGESPIVGVEITLWADTNGDGNIDTQVGTVTTDSNGNYYFGGIDNINMTGIYTLEPQTEYELHIALNDNALNVEKPTRKDVNNDNDDVRDSDGDNGVLHDGYSTIVFRTGNYGENDHTLDFGFSASEPAINVEKLTNGEDADNTNGPKLNVGDTVTWTYVVTNTGNETLNNISLNDDKEGIIDCRGGATLSVGESMTCIQIDTVPKSAVGRTYVNTAMVTGMGARSGTSVNDTDPSHYHVEAVSLGSVVWSDTNNNGLQDAGEPGIGGVIVTLLDSNGNPVSDIQPVTTGIDGKYMFDTLSEGDYQVQVDMSNVQNIYVPAAKQNTNANDDKDNDSNIATSNGNIYISATVTLEAGTEPIESGGLAGTDSADNIAETNGNMTVDFGFFSPAPAINVEKSTNGEDADNTNGPKLNVGDTVTWTYVVTNTGNETLNNISLNDDQEGKVICDHTTLVPDTSMVCTKRGYAKIGSYVNVATVTAQGALSGYSVSDSDPSHYNTIVTAPTDQAQITGNVRVVDSAGRYSALSGVILVLFDENGNEVSRTKTNSSGHYSFSASPGHYYIQEIQPREYYSISEDEGGADNDANNPLRNTISVILDSGEYDIQNDFVESHVPGCNICKPTICHTCAAASATVEADGNVILRWRPVTNEEEYEIYLNGKFIGIVNKDITEYRLKNLESDKMFEVDIVAIGKKGGVLKQTITFKIPFVSGSAWLPAIYGLILQ